MSKKEIENMLLEECNNIAPIFKSVELKEEHIEIIDRRDDKYGIPYPKSMNEFIENEYFNQKLVILKVFVLGDFPTYKLS